MEKAKKLFGFVLKRYHHRNGTVIGKAVGAILTDNLETAEKIVYEKYVSELCTLESIEEVNEEFCHTVYKCSL